MTLTRWRIVISTRSGQVIADFPMTSSVKPTELEIRTLFQRYNERAFSALYVIDISAA